jgi:hypothetical protein
MIRNYISLSKVIIKLSIIILKGWQPIPSNWLTRKGYMAVFMTPNHCLRLYGVKKISEQEENIQFYCYLCKKKLCSHIKEELKEER